MRHARAKIALAFLAAALVVNVIILARGEESAGWPLAVIVLLGAAGASLLAERRPWQ